MRHDDTGWFKIGNTFSNEVYDINEGEIEELLALTMLGRSMSEKMQNTMTSTPEISSWIISGC